MMELIRMFAASAAIVLAGCSSFPGSGARQADEHDGHYRDRPAAESAPKTESDAADQRTKAMQKMQEMHRKMMVAKTPAERAALMKDHMQAMQNGMAMMGQMNGRMSMQSDGRSPGAQGPSHREHMTQRMDMMEMMMQMMLDREAARLPAK